MKTGWSKPFHLSDLGNMINMDAIRGAKISRGVDPLGGAGVHYWAPIAERYGLNLTVVNEAVDPTSRFMTVDWDGQIRMDPSSPYAMQRLIGLEDRFEIAFACDTDHDRHGIVTRSAGLLLPNPYLAAAIFYLFQHRPKWRPETALGKTVVSSQMIDRVTSGGLKGIAESGWFAARPSGTEDIYKIYAESFGGADHLRRILEEAQTLVNDALAAEPERSGVASNTNWGEKL